MSESVDAVCNILFVPFYMGGDGAMTRPDYNDDDRTDVPPPQSKCDAADEIKSTGWRLSCEAHRQGVLARYTQ